jgi:hypothetical protein
MQGVKRRRVRTPVSAKRRVLLGCVCAVVLGYFELIGRFLSSQPESTLPRREQPIYTPHVPPLGELVHGWNITGNVSFLMDFAIVGFPKTGTSSLMFYLEQYKSSIFTFRDERCELGWNQHVKLIREMHKEYLPTRRMGIKCPGNLEVDLALSNYNRYFPTTKFIVGLRHPIPWFQSFYNFRVTNEFPMPPAEKLIGKCVRANQGVCTFRAQFSEHLKKVEPWRNVFIYHVDQLQENPDGTIFRRDLGKFLEVYEPLSKPLIWVKPGQKGLDAERQQEIDGKKIDICHDRYQKLRAVLLKQAVESADWILNVFLSQSNVIVSNRPHFQRLLEDWHLDPCDS